MEIPFLNLATDKKRAVIRKTLAEIERVALSADFIQGAKVAEFESCFAEREGGGNSAVACNSGLDALILALRAVGVGPGDEVITSPFSFVATGAAISLLGARPVFADIGWDGVLDPQSAEAAVTPKTKAVLPVLWAGIPGNLPAFRELCERHGLALVLDAAQAVGTKCKGRPVSAFADAVCYSLHPLKNLGVWGDGGILLTGRKDLDDLLRLSRNHGLVNRDEAAFFSLNSRLDTIQACVALSQMELLPEILESRAAHARRYLAGLGSLVSLKIPLALSGVEEVGVHLFQIVVENREGLRAYLADEGIETKVHYPILIPFQKSAASLGYERGDFPVAERFADGVISLPIREDLTQAQVDQIVSTIRVFFRSDPAERSKPAELNL